MSTQVARQTTRLMMKDGSIRMNECQQPAPTSGSGSSVDWLEVDFSGAGVAFPALEVALIDSGHNGWVDLSQVPASEQEYQQEQLLPQELRRPLLPPGSPASYCYRLYLAKEGPWEERLAQLHAIGADLQLTVTEGNQVRDEDWAENWKEFYQPLAVGRSLVILPSWLELPPEHKQRSVISLDPGSAFGTGYHPTSQLCLEIVESYCLKVNSHLNQVQMLDVGTGSGILSIGAWRLGVRQIVATDNDPVATKVCQENFRLNGVEAQVVHCSGSGLGLPAGTTSAFDLIVANIVAQTLIELAPHLKKHLKPGGHLVLGGIIDHRRPDIDPAFEAVGLRIISECEREGWYSLLLA